MGKRSRSTGPTAICRGVLGQRGGVLGSRRRPAGGKRTGSRIRVALDAGGNFTRESGSGASHKGRAHGGNGRSSQPAVQRGFCGKGDPVVLPKRKAYS